ncbi:4a-hydroxytetrahydrobiopterin dehydratase [Planctomycetales bacterium ZRK34]|nr:4a-hydroxytetrahydrobiopterin dehydratase [Planctomycetales bacterium ZRK34]
MNELSNSPCEACRADAPRVTDAEIQQLTPQIPEWSLIEVEGVKQLKRTYEFKNFIEALTFTNKVGDIAESAGHHPAILTEWGRVTLRWWTHKIKGLHRNDFIMAAKSDVIYKA